ncbi:MAG: hypothetical protein HZC19_03890 [Candidatus Omnitrophica bacterium]|nr:hypothetical protein [Candidatus Omnitrophota bacterium]
MVDKKTEADIKALNGFLEYWRKFHSIHKKKKKKEIITNEEEAIFLETKKLVRDKYDALKKGLEFKYMPHARLTDPVNDILSLNTIRFMSEKNLKKLNDDWRDSYIFLNNILEHLKNKKRRLEQFNPISVYLKRFFERIAV